MARTPVPAGRGRFETFVGGYEDPQPGVAYPGVLRRPGTEGWRTVIGVVAGFVFYLSVMSALPGLVIGVAWLVAGRGQAYQQFARDAAAYLNPAGMLAMNLAIGCLIPVSWLMVAGIHRTAPRWLASVGPRIRWRYLAVCAIVAVVVLNAMQVVTWLIDGTAVHLVPQQGFWGFLVVILTTTWVQATGEEYFFRGYLMQALGSLTRTPWFGVITSALIFAVMHGSQNVPLFLNRLAFGLVAALLVWLTGGLEAGIAGHVVNNVFAYVWAGLTVGIAASRTVTETSWLGSLIGVGGYAVYALAAWGIARAMRIGTTTTVPAAVPGRA
ncbi:CPBP family intramembrane glutamic endopeptidase [Raineyella sp. LH-20]|uniref:CPBP family intramembrane glutamic endopeptidase n=1 Tax=Raineyella sp. LH-20 TaxID=3081204 RepID=UPI002955D07F|nr:CPBP family intramembrane glutamic endopeptidase [Raineyella sp. LH-20]WOP18326.1 CPBP family intramembrane glutamic endopeptidase [Raineyella sp. LH-20]